MARVLVVDDDPALCASISGFLNDDGLDVVTTPGSSGLTAAFSENYEVIVLDLASMELSVAQFLSKLRHGNIATPVLLISTEGREQELAAGLDEGADGYLTKPVSLLVLLARIRALLRRSGLVEREVLYLGALTVNFVSRKGSYGGRIVDFSRRELDLLKVLAAHSNTALSRQALLHAAWGHRDGATLNLVDVYISYLRKRLRSLGIEGCIQTRRGLGYQLNAPIM